VPLPTDNAPGARNSHTAVWTGTSMIVWGGRTGGIYGPCLDTGGTFDAASNTWSAISTVSAPSARADHLATWTGGSMVVWGGTSNTTALRTGGTFTPVP